MSVQPIPAGRSVVTAYLTVPSAAKVIDFTKAAFGAEVVFPPMAKPDGSIMHAEVKIGDSVIMLGEPMQGCPAMPGAFYVYVKDVDATFQRALRAGATSLNEPMDMFYGDRCGAVKDFAGNRWTIATHVEDVSMEEMKRRSAAFMQQPVAQ